MAVVQGYVLLRNTYEVTCVVFQNGLDDATLSACTALTEKLNIFCFKSLWYGIPWYLYRLGDVIQNGWGDLVSSRDTSSQNGT